MSRIKLALLSLILSACAMQRIELTDDNHPSGALKEIREAANDSWIYAQLASTIYGGDGDGFVSNYLTQLESKASDWSGFKAAAYRLRLPGSEEKLVVAYAGTEDWRDWVFGNLNPANTQYKQGLLFLRELISKYADYDNVILTGHSLGGAIAIYAASREPDMQAFIFNPSIRVRASGYGAAENIHSISQYAEILSVLRKAAPNPSGTYTTLGCNDSNPISQHAMRTLAECLTHVAAWESTQALESLRENLLGEPKRIDRSTNTLVL